ncbi:hypothetical protein DKP78_22050, partial [Enterococcus faecium]
SQSCTNLYRHGHKHDTPTDPGAVVNGHWGGRGSQEEQSLLPVSWGILPGSAREDRHKDGNGQTAGMSEKRGR